MVVSVFKPLLDRRSLLVGLGSCAATPLFFSNAQSAFQPKACQSALGNRIRIIDSARDLTSTAADIFAAGVTTVIRYYAREGGQWCGKTLSKTELKALDKAGLSVAVVFQNNNNQADFFYDEQKALLDAKAALDHADTLKQPPGTPIYFGADFDLGLRRKKGPDGSFLKKDNDFVMEGSEEILEKNKAALTTYFQRINEELNKKNYKVGVYGCGGTHFLLSKPGKELADYFWISASVSYNRTAEFYNTGNWHLFQNKVELPSRFVVEKCADEYGRKETQKQNVRVIDTNILNPRFEDFGQWRLDGSRPPHSTTASQKVFSSRAFVIKDKAPIYSGSPDAIGSVDATKLLRYSRNVRVLCQHGDYVAVGLSESDEVYGYCKASDLTSDFKQMPPWPKSS